ncbi:MAG: ComF family protein [Lachnospiraceae bacterium]
MRILDILYPARCPVCHGVIRGKGRVCRECREKLAYIREPRCKKCGKQLEKKEQEYCRDCMRYEHDYTRGGAVFAYDEVMKQSIYRFKYHNRREYAAFYAEEMYRVFAKTLNCWKPEVILPVPMHAGKKRKRGFNQAELVAAELGKLAKIPVDTGALVRKKKTVPQKELTRSDRKRNLKDAFLFAAPKDKKYERVLLIDDIYTTGATLDAVSEVLRKNQIKNIFFLTICVGSDA